jgi:phenylalanyl-tRNA synthetase beta chain
MKLSLQWIKELIGNNVSDEEIIYSIEKLGYEIESISKQNYDVLSKIKVVKVLSVKKHPNADKLVICNITDGKENYEVVCGAPNVYEGMISAYVGVGGILADGTKVEQRKIRGVVSNGMLCSAKELGLYDDHSGILDLEKNFELGEPLSKYFSDTIIEVSTPANRYDCLGHYGIAKELAIKLGLNFKDIFIDTKNFVNHLKAFPMFDVNISSYQLCKRYIAIQIDNVNNKVSLPWYIKYRLYSLGLRSINPLVDISNYVMLLVGHSVHIFDFDKLAGSKIFVKTANNNDKVLALDNRTYNLDSSIIVISDEEKPVAIAGIIGLENSCVDENTKNIVIESAVFNRSMIRLARKKLGINTEASFRFERGSGFNLAEFAAVKTCQMVLDYCGGEIVKFSDIKDVEYYNNLVSFPQNAIKVDLDYINSILGFEIDKERFIDILVRLNYQLKNVESSLINHKFFVLPPVERQDVKFQADIIEEIARFIGYENVPSKLPHNINDFYKQKLTDKVQEQIIEYLISVGFNQAINYSLCSSYDNSFVLNKEQKVITILNPVSNEYSQMRLTLFSSLLRNVITNYEHQTENIALFELGKVFYKQNNEIKEEIRLGIIAHGEHQYLSWARQGIQYDFYYLCGVVETLLDIFGIKYIKDIEAVDDIDKPILDKTLFKNLVYYITDDKKTISFVGELDKEKLKLKLPKPVLYGEVSFGLILQKLNIQKVYTPLPKYPYVIRDLCLRIPDEFGYSQIEHKILQVIKNKNLVVEIYPIDFYKKDEKEKYLTFRLKLRSETKTLTDDEVNVYIKDLLDELKKEGIYLREK